MNRLPILYVALLVACATDHQQAAPNLLGYFPLPPALSADPTKLKIPPLDFKVRKP